MNPIPSLQSESAVNPEESRGIKRPHETSTNSVSEAAQKSLYCHESLDDECNESPPPLKPIDPCQVLEQKLFQNFFFQINKLHHKELTLLTESLPEHTAAIQAVAVSAIKSDHLIPLYEEFLKDLYKIAFICEKSSSQKELKNIIQQTVFKIIESMHTQINARSVYELVIDHFIPVERLSKKIELPHLLNGIPHDNQTPLTERLSNSWVLASLTTQNLNSHPSVNIPNRVFQITCKNDLPSIDVFRMRSPELLSSKIVQGSELDPFYKFFLQHHAQQKTSHLSLIMLSPSIFETEVIPAETRYQAQSLFPHSLFAWGCDADSDFVCQDAEYEIFETAVEFINTLSEELLENEAVAFRIPPDLRQSESFKLKTKEILQTVHRLMFSNQPILNPEEKQDFILIATVMLLEHICELKKPASLDTACRSHIDRGMMMTTVFYIYLLIKSGKINQLPEMDYLPHLIFAPALLFAHRPPHPEKMQRVLSVIGLLTQPDVIKKLQGDRTYFSDCQVEIPSLFDEPPVQDGKSEINPPSKTVQDSAEKPLTSPRQ
jgi:hypothetical protein